MTDNTDPLQALLAEAALEDKDAFRLIYDTTAARLFGILLRILKQQDLAEEILQEVYLSIWDKAKTYHPEQGSPLSWMAAIARNRAINMLRQTDERTVKLSLSDDYNENLIETLLDQTSPTDSPNAHAALLKCFDEMELKHKECILLAYQYGLTRDELSERYDVPSDTVKTWLRLAITRLSGSLGNMMNEKELDVIAGEYVLGSLPRKEWAEAQKLADTNLNFVALVNEWEQQLAPLEVSNDSVAPPLGAWHLFAKRLEEHQAIVAAELALSSDEHEDADFEDVSALDQSLLKMRRSRNFWRGFALFLLGLVALLGGYIGLPMAEIKLPL